MNRVARPPPGQSPPGLRYCWHYMHATQQCAPAHDQDAEGPLLAHGFCTDQCGLAWCCNQVWYGNRWRRDFGIRFNNLREDHDDFETTTRQKLNHMEINWNNIFTEKFNWLQKQMDHLCDFAHNVKDNTDGDLASFQGQISSLQAQMAWIQDNHDHYLQVCQELLHATNELHQQLKLVKSCAFWGCTIIVTYKVVRLLMS